MPNFGYDEVWEGLVQSLKLQSHYAELLNMHDGGERIGFKTPKEWLERLREIEKLTCKHPCDDPACAVHGINASLARGHE